MKKWIIIIISIVVAIAGGYLVYKNISHPDKLSSATISVHRGEIIESISVTGTVIPVKNIELQFENQGKIQKIEASVSDRVETDQILIRLDTGELNAQLQANQATLEIAKAKLSQILAGTRKEDIQVYKTAVNKAMVDVENKEQSLINIQNDAENDLDQSYEDALDIIKSAYTVADQALLITYVEIRQKYFNTSDQVAFEVKNKEDAAKNNLSLTKLSLDAATKNPSHDNISLVLDDMKDALMSARNSLAYLRTALDDTSVKDDVIAADETKINTERGNIDDEIINITSANQAINSTKITNQTNINDAQSDLASTKATLKKAEDELVLKEAGPRQADIDLAQAEIKKAQANITEIQTKINKSILRSPTEGIITNIEKEEGETAIANSTILSMIGLGQFQIEANVSEAEIARINLKDETKMTLDALGPNENFTGHIIKINPAETVVSGVIYYKVTAVFNNEDKRIKSGMTVNIDIEIDRKENVLYLPYYAIRETNDKKFVEVLEEKIIKEKEIETGIEGETRIEITKGLREGEEVLINR